jgi:predicted phosphodiesterase
VRIFRRTPTGDTTLATNEQKPARSLEQFADDRATARYTENQEIARSNRALRAAVEKKDKELADIKKKLGLFEALTDASIAAPTWLTPSTLKDRHAIPSMLFTDVHWDEVVKPAQIDGINCYNRPIAESRVERAFKRAIRVARDYLSGVTYEGFNLFLGGDLLSGIIHEELTETNQGTVIESILSILEPLSAGIRLLAEEFGRVHATAVVGNHGRRTQKPKAKNRVQDNFDWLVYKLLQRELARDKRITLEVPEGPDGRVSIYGVRYLLTHGDQFKGGSGISAALAPLLLGTHRKTRRNARAGKPYDVMVMGHFHSSIWMPTKGLIVGGSVCGYNEYAYQQNLDPEDPQCAFWLTTPEHGITINAPVFVGDRLAEGW